MFIQQLENVVLPDGGGTATVDYWHGHGEMKVGDLVLRKENKKDVFIVTAIVEALGGSHVQVTRLDVEASYGLRADELVVAPPLRPFHNKAPYTGA